MISADQAREQTAEVVASQIAELESEIMKKITETVRRGQSSVMLSLGGKSMAAQEAVKLRLRNAGYTVKEPTGGDQRDYGYVTLSWLTAGAVSE